MNKKIVLSIIISSALIIISLIITKDKSGDDVVKTKQNIESSVPLNNVYVENGVQIIEIRAKGGYLPRLSYAKAGIPTTLRFLTNATFDCSAFVRIPSLNITKNLELSGKTEVDLGIQEKGILNGACNMGMYPFDVEFN